MYYYAISDMHITKYEHMRSYIYMYIYYKGSYQYMCITKY
jgi:hypothetical protein